MTTKQIAQFLANIKGNTYLVDGEKARVEGVSINPTTGRVMITTNKGTKFWNKGNTAFTQVFSQQVSPGRTIPSVIARPTDETETLDTKPTVYLRKQDQPTKVHTTTPTSTAPATLPPAQPVLPTPYLYNRIQLLMDLRKINTRQLAELMGLTYNACWCILRKCDTHITLGLNEGAIKSTSLFPTTNDCKMNKTINNHYTALSFKPMLCERVGICARGSFKNQIFIF